MIHLSPRPGTNAAVVLGLCHVVRRDGLTDPDFIAQRTEGYEAVEELLEAYTPEAVQEICEVPAAQLERAAHIYGEASRIRCSGGWGSPSTSTAPRSCSCCATWRR